MIDQTVTVNFEVSVDPATTERLDALQTQLKEITMETQLKNAVPADAWIADFVKRLGEAGVAFTVEPSVVVRSPYLYVYVWLTEHQDGEHPYLLVSSLAEYEDDTSVLLYGEYKDYEDDSVPDEVPDAEEALRRVLARVAS